MTSSETVRRLARGAVYPTISGLWWLTLRLGGRALFGKADARPWRPGGRVLVVAPHPDDETLGAGGVIARHVQAGDQVVVAVVTDGRGSRAGGLSAAAMAGRRGPEVAAAMGRLGATRLHALALPEGAWQDEAAAGALIPLLAATDVVYGPSVVDYHPEHLRVARLLGGLVRPGQVVRSYEVGVPLTPLLANVLADVSDEWQAKERALACYRSQQEGILLLRRLDGYRAGLYGRAAVEPFWELSAERYAAVGRAAPWGAADTPFRGLRPRPTSDLNAFLAGRRERRWLAAVARRAAE